MNVAHYTKFLVPLLGTVLLGVLSAYVALKDSLGVVSITFVVLTLLVAAINIVTTYRFPAGTSDTITGSVKFWGNVAHVLLQAVLAIIGTTQGLGDVSVIQWAGVVIAILQALGVGILPNEPKLAAVQQNLDGSTVNLYEIPAAQIGAVQTADGVTRGVIPTSAAVPLDNTPESR